MWASSAGAARVERHQHDAGRGKAEERLEVAVTIGRQESDAVTSANAEISNHAGQLSASIGKLVVRERSVAVDDRDTVTEATSGMLERIGQRHHRATTL